MVLKEGKPHGTGFVARFEGVEDRNAAEVIRNVDLFVSRSALPELEADEYYWYQLVGLEVISTDGTPFGEVDHLLETGAHDVIVVKDNKGTERLIPYVPDEIVQKIDLDAGTMTVAWQADY